MWYNYIYRITIDMQCQDGTRNKMADIPKNCDLAAQLLTKSRSEMSSSTFQSIEWVSETTDEDFSDDDSVADEDYIPVQDASSSDENDHDQNPNNEKILNTAEELSLEAPHEEIQENIVSRKRKRNLESWKMNKRKRLRNLGQEYTSTTGKITPARIIQPFQHICRYECKTFTEERRRIIHEEYWKTGSWQQQTSFIVKCVSTTKPRRPKQNCNKSKKRSTVIFLDGKRVCKEFFLKTLTISNRRFTTAALNKPSVEGLSPVDKRGKHAPGNKIPEDRLATIRNHIKSFPHYTSHYSRNDNPHKKYLSPELSVSKMYKLYTEKCEEENILPVKECIYRKVFNSEFNLSFYKLRSDTCNTCDRLENLIKAEEDISKRNNLMLEKELHLRKVDQARAAKKVDIQKSKEGATQVIAFDLEKTLPTPMLTTNVIYYKRQLWTFNLGIHDCRTDHAFMYMWSENTASRGPSEIGSCLLKYVKSLPSEIKHVIAYSDSCGGQNRNQIIARFWLYIVAHTSIEIVDHKFLVPGHSYLENDADFSHIEKKKRHTQFIFVPQDWMKLVENARVTFHVNEMKQEDFLSTEPIANLLINRKIDTEKQKVNWLTMRWMQYRKVEPRAFFFKETLNEDIEFRKVNLARPCRSATLPAHLPLLRYGPVCLKQAKIDDLMSLLQFIPPVYHNFYKSLSPIRSLPENQPGRRGRPRGRPRGRGRGQHRLSHSPHNTAQPRDEESYPDDCDSDAVNESE